MAKVSKSAPEKGSKDAPQAGLAFGRGNYIFLLAGVGVLVLGYILMIGGGSDDPNVFKEDELFSTRRVTIAPVTLLVGFGLVLYGIMKKSR